MNNSVKSFIAMAVTAFIWSNAFMHIQTSLEVIGPVTLVALRFAIAWAVLIIFQKVKGIHEEIQGKDRPRIFINSVIGSIIYFGISNLTITYLPAVDSATLSSMQLILMLWLESMFLDNIIPPKKTFYVMIATIGGILLMRLVSISMASMISYNLMIVATFLWSVYYIIQIPLLKKYKATTLIRHQAFYAMVVTAPFILLEGNQFALITGRHMMSIAYLGVFGIGVAYSFNSYALAKIGPTNTSLMLIFQPVILLFMDYFYKERAFILTDYIGLGMIVIGFLLMMHAMAGRDQLIKKRGQNV